VPYSVLESSRSMFVSRRLAASRGYRVGEVVPLTTASGPVGYRVAAIVAHSLPSPGGDEAALISMANGRQDLGMTGFNILQVIPTANPPSGFDLSLRDAATRYGMQLESLQDVRDGVRHGLDSLLLLLTGVGLVGVILGLLSVVETILLNISESSRELGLLRAVGATRGQVRGIILAQSGLFGFCGAVIGVLVGLALVAVMLRAGSSLGFEPGYQAPWQVILAVVAVAVVGSLLAVVVPARRASGASVVASLRYE
jgi:putative ABC transport system permease protein